MLKSIAYWQMLIGGEVVYHAPVRTGTLHTICKGIEQERLGDVVVRTDLGLQGVSMRQIICETCLVTYGPINAQQATEVVESLLLPNTPRFLCSHHAAKYHTIGLANYTN